MGCSEFERDRAAGLRDIVLDYIQPRGLRLAVLSLIAVVLLGVLVRVLLSLAAVALAT